MSKPGIYAAREGLKLDNEYRHFVVESESGLKAVDLASLEHIRIREHRKSFADRYGCPAIFTLGDCATGLATEKGKEPTQGVGGVVWKKISPKDIDTSKYDCWQPERGRKQSQKDAYNKVQREMREIRSTNAGTTVAAALGMETVWTSDAPHGRMYIHSPALFEIGDMFVLSYKNAADDMTIPDGVREISQIEFLEAVLAEVKKEAPQ